MIIDQDLETDVGDALALACAHALMDNGECNILGVALCGTYDDSPFCADAINTYYHRPQIPVGVNAGPTIAPGPLLSNPFTTNIKNAFPRQRSSFEDARTLYRRLLVSQPDQSVTIATLGFFSNLAHLLGTTADQYSPLSGSALMAAKVIKVCSMAGDYLTGHEYNNYVDAGSATYFCANCPVPIEFTGFTQSGLVVVGSSVAATIPKTSPIRRAYDIFFAEYGGTTREAWDQLSILHAVRGLGSYWTRSSAGTNVVDGSGNNTFTVGAGQHYYLTNLMSANGLASVIEALQTQAPSGGFH